MAAAPMKEADSEEEWEAIATAVAHTSPKYVRGRFYDLYSARRNERLKRKKADQMAAADPEAVAEDPCVAVELSRRRTARTNKSSLSSSLESAIRRSVPANFSVGKLRSSLTSNKEMKKAMSTVSFERSPSDVGMRIRSRSVLRMT